MSGDPTSDPAARHRLWLTALFRSPMPVPPPPGCEPTEPRAPPVSTVELESWFTRDHTLHQTIAPALPRGPAGVRFVAERLGRAFDSWTFDLEDAAMEGDLASCRFVARARHVGDLGAMKATGTPIRVTGMLLSRFVDGRASETWAEVDAWAALVAARALRPVPEALLPDAANASTLETGP